MMMARKNKVKYMFLQEMSEQMKFLDMLFLEDGRQGDALKQSVQAYRIFHSWKSSAPIFGFDDIGRVAVQLENLWRWAGEAESTKFVLSEWVDKFRATCEATLPYYREIDLERAFRLKELERTDCEDQAQPNSRQQRILVVDDDPILRSIVAQSLRTDGYLVDEARGVESAKTKLRQNIYHLITIDLIMEPIMGYELFEFLKQDINLKWIPLIVLSGRDDLPDKVKCFRLGADDYLTKPFEMDELIARIARILSRMTEFEQMAFRDPLTGIYNRRYIDNQIDIEIKRVLRNPAPISICFLDIDRFKLINDTYGHQVGDLVLQGLAHKLQNTLRSSDFLGRYGGEEFLVILPGSNEEQAKIIMENFLSSIRGMSIARNEGKDYTITCSVGIAGYDGKETMVEWLGRADSAMYQAKQDGRDRVYVDTNSYNGNSSVGGAKKRVLIAEDEDVLRSIIVSLMSSAGYSPTESVDGIMAYELLSKEHYDIALIGLVMPGMDGLTLLTKIKNESLPNSNRMKTIVFSTNKEDQDINRALALGADGFLTKPFSLIELELKVKQLLLDHHDEYQE